MADTRKRHLKQGFGVWDYESMEIHSVYHGIITSGKKTDYYLLLQTGLTVLTDSERPTI